MGQTKIWLTCRIVFWCSNIEDAQDIQPSSTIDRIKQYWCNDLQNLFTILIHFLWSGICISLPWYPDIKSKLTLLAKFSYIIPNIITPHSVYVCTRDTDLVCQGSADRIPVGSGQFVCSPHFLLPSLSSLSVCGVVGLGLSLVSWLLPTGGQLEVTLTHHYYLWQILKFNLLYYFPIFHLTGAIYILLWDSGRLFGLDEHIWKFQIVWQMTYLRIDIQTSLPIEGFVTLVCLVWWQ